MPRIFLTISATILVGAAIVVVAATRSAPTSSPLPVPSLGSISPDGPVPVIVELFTSEGCSSCPPADAVLTRLATEQPVPGAAIIPMGEHVDYWDRLGWRDPFSSASFSARQSEYDSKAFRRGSIYTPQMVVDGGTELIGSDYRRATAAIARAARQSKPALQLSIDGRASTGSPSSLRVGIEAPAGLSATTATTLMLAVTEDGLETDVKRGENGGRELHHSAVVRTLIQAGTVPAGSTPWSTGATLPISADWNADRLRVVAFAQEPRTRQIVAATSRVVGH